MQPTQDRLGADGVRFSAAMARIGMWVLDRGERQIRDTGTQRQVRTPGIVQLDNVRPTVPIAANFSIHGIPGTAATFSFIARSTEHSRQHFTVA
jgi:hypothetical protein